MFLRLKTLYKIRTLSLKIISGLSSVCYKTTLITGVVGGAGAGKPPDPLFLKQNRESGGFRASSETAFIWKLL